MKQVQVCLKELTKRLSFTNQKAKKSDPHYLLPPNIYIINDEFVAMAKTNCPSLEEILSPERTKRGAVFFKALEKKYGAKSGVTMKRLRESARLLYTRAHFERANVILIGYKDAQFQVMPLADLV